MIPSTLYEVVYKLVGQIEPVGESHIDSQRFENLKMMCELIDRLITDISRIEHQNEYANEASRKQSYNFVRNFLYHQLEIKEPVK